MKLSATRTNTQGWIGRRVALDLPLLAALLAGLLLRLLLWGNIPRTGMISDEGEYLSAASWLAHGYGFDWYQGYLWTRAPLYPLFLAAHLRIFGDRLAPIYATQTLLSLLNIALVYFIARHLTRGQATGDRRQEIAEIRLLSRISHLVSRLSVPSLAALLMALYLPFAIYAQALLSETLFISLLLGGFLALARAMADDRRRAKVEPPTTDDRRPPTDDSGAGSRVPAGWHTSGYRGRQSGDFVILSSRHLVRNGRLLVIAGALFGLATLTRSITLLFLPIVALWLLLGQPRGAEAQRRRGAEAKPVALSFRRLFMLRKWARIGAERFESGPVQHIFSASRTRALNALLFLACAGALILPWTIYNSRTYGGLVVIDTSGAFNILLGGRTAYDGRRQDAPPRNFVLALLDPRPGPAERRALLSDACLLRHDDPRLLDALGRQTSTISQAERQRLMTAEGLCLIGERPLAFVAKSLGELVDLFQINYSGDERFADGFTTGRLPPWYALGLFLLDDSLYVLVLPLAVIGWAIARGQGPGISDQKLGLPPLIPDPRSPIPGLIGLWWLYNIALAPLLFAINRFRLPLLPFAFIFAAYALATLGRGASTTSERPIAGRWKIRAFWGALALALTVIATTPYAYLQPAAASEDAQPASAPSYLGPAPSSLDSTWRALAARPRYLATQQLQLALQAGQLDRAEAILRSESIDPRIVTLSRALIAGQMGRYDQGLAALSDDPTLASDKSYRVLASVVRGDLLRGAGRMAEARAALGGSDRTRFVDDANPVQWAWDWLRPAPLPDNHLDLAGDLDLGYIEGCYLGEGDPEAQGTFRWCGDGAQLRFPGAGTGAAQTLVLLADGRGWLGGWLPVPPVRVLLGGQLAGTFTPSHTAVAEFSVVLPPSPPGADVVVTLRTPTFIPDAARYLSQQGSQVGQAQRLGVRLDWAELREPRQ
jgi:4-amino-4-deoxy-L-arabinose transferase-like glycosyltransferase